MAIQVSVCNSCKNQFTYEDHNAQTLRPSKCIPCALYLNLSPTILGKEHGIEWAKEDHPKKGTKNDSEKPMLSLVPKEAYWEMGKALTYGAKKYGKHNFREGIDITRLLDGTLRHTTQFLDGEDIDEETQCIHLGNAMAGLAMAIWMLKNKPEHDDRYKKK